MNRLNFIINRLVITTLCSLFVLSVFNLQTAWAQSTERFSVDYRELGDSNDISISGFFASYAHRLYLDKDGANLLTLGMNYSRVDLLDDTLAAPDRSRELQALAPEINLLRILNDKYSLAITLKPGFYGNLSGSLSDEFRLEGGFVVTRFMTDNLTLGLGLGRGTNFGRDLIVPLFQFLYFATDKIVISGLLPARASAWYIPSQKWEFGLLFELQGSMYDLEETNIAGAERLGLAAAQLGLGARYKMFGNYFVVADAGYTILRRYLWDDKTSPSFNIGDDPFLDRDLDPVPYFRVGIIQKF
jgi:hypothetical protein